MKRHVNSIKSLFFFWGGGPFFVFLDKNYINQAVLYM